jgi:hypothetical protein
MPSRGCRVGAVSEIVEGAFALLAGTRAAVDPGGLLVAHHPPATGESAR